MELWQLRYFIAVAEVEHVGRAAERLHISQSPLSKQIRQLEAQLGVALFERVGRAVRLSSIGRDFLGRARELVEHADRFETSIRSVVRGEAGSVDIGYVQGAAYNDVLPGALARLKTKFPAIEPRLHPMGSRAQVVALRAGRLDLALTHRDPLDLRSTLVADEAFVVVAKSTDNEATAADWLPRQNWITLPRSSASTFHDEFHAACSRLGFSPKIIIETTDIPSALGFVAAGLGVSIVQESIGRSLPKGLITRTTDPLGMRIKTFVLRRKEPLPPAAERILDALTSSSAGSKGPAQAI